MRCAKTISRPGMASYHRKSLLTSHSVIEMCYSFFMDTKYKCLRCELTICNKCSVFEENEDVEGWTAGKSVAYCEAKADEYCISAFRLQLLAVTSSASSESHGDTCLFPCFNEVQLVK